jgi:hypothetical protein
MVAGRLLPTAAFLQAQRPAVSGRLLQFQFIVVCSSGSAQSDLLRVTSYAGSGYPPPAKHSSGCDICRILVTGGSLKAKSGHEPLIPTAPLGTFGASHQRLLDRQKRDLP